jgi:tetratricopeptide (TPR) repeat protein
MTEATKEALHAFSSGHYDYEQAIQLYDKEIEENAFNYAAYNNRGLCKIHLGSQPYNANLIKDGMEDFNTAIELAKKEGVTFESAQHNLALAINMLNF